MMDDLINTEEKLLHSLEMEQLKWLINMVGTALLAPSPFMLPTTPDQHTINIQGWHGDKWCGWIDSWILIASVWLEVKAISAALFGYLLKVSEEKKTLFLFAPRGGRVLFFFNLHIGILPTAERERPCEANQPAWATHLDLSQPRTSPSCVLILAYAGAGCGSRKEEGQKGLKGEIFKKQKR